MKNNSKKGNFKVLGEDFSAEHFPILYRMYQANRENLEGQLQSVADAWHEGNIASAAMALESDLAHG